MRRDTPAQHYDITVIGGGLVGASFALLLQRMMPAPLRVLVIEAADHPQDVSGQLKPADDFDVRTTALSHGSCVIYQQAGLWQDLAPWVTDIARIHVSDKGRLGSVSMDAAAQSVPALGHVLENRHLGAVLTGALQQSADIDLLCPARVNTISPDAQGMRLQLVHGEERTTQITSALVVLADGGKSDICQQLGIERQHTAYRQQAVIANVAFSAAHRHVAYERFTGTGPMAILPLPDLKGEHRGALIWTLPENDAVRLAAMPDEEFLFQLQQYFGYRLGRFLRVGRRSCFPLALSVAKEQVRPGLVLLGNVAHTLHPVAGQGLNLALRDARALAEHLRSATARGQAAGEAGLLHDYVNSQQSDQHTTIAFSHHVIDLFADDNLLKVWARKLGLFSVDLMPAVSRHFTRQAMGMADRRSARLDQ